MEKSTDNQECDKEICLVTGATGFIGSALVEYLLNKGYAVRILYRKTSKMDNLSDVEDKIEKIYCDLTNPENLEEAVRGVQYVFHLAGVITAPDYEIYNAVNVVGVENIVKAALEYGAETMKRFVLVSSQAAGGPSTKNAPKHEDDESACATDYGRSKREGELAMIKLFEEKDSDLHWSIVRPPAVFGERDTAIYGIFKSLKRGIEPVFGTYPIMRLNVVYVKDLIDGIYAAAMHEKGAFEAFNIADARIYKMTEVTKAIKRAIGKRFTVRVYFPTWIFMLIAHIFSFFAWIFNFNPKLSVEQVKIFGIRNWTIDVSKAKQLLDWEAKTPLDEAMANTANWYRKNRWL
ncbi:MAG: SDR family NAD(P)-dependent oxidoreductase [Planctomycetes bacterium]|nr:SDR family NAD(P)-dependent oxidoreductase [Planctomycetota bacterium]